MLRSNRESFAIVVGMTVITIKILKAIAIMAVTEFTFSVNIITFHAPVNIGLANLLKSLEKPQFHHNIFLL